MANRNPRLLLGFLSLFAALQVQAQEKSLEELLSLDMNDLLKLKVVSALKEPETIGKVPATVRVITADEIRDNGYFTLEDALADLPGFQFRNIQGFNSYVFMRGVPSQNNKILLLVDGIQVNELNSGGFYAGGQFNLTNVDRIEVVYGPASALYGTNAVSGIVSVITRDPKESPGRPRLRPGRELRHAPRRYPVRPLRQGRGFRVQRFRHVQAERQGGPRGRRRGLQLDRGDGELRKRRGLRRPGPVQGFQRGRAVPGQGRLPGDRPAGNPPAGRDPA